MGKYRNAIKHIKKYDRGFTCLFLERVGRDTGNMNLMNLYNKELALDEEPAWIHHYLRNIEEGFVDYLHIDMLREFCIGMFVDFLERADRG